MTNIKTLDGSILNVRRLALATVLAVMMATSLSATAKADPYHDRVMNQKEHAWEAQQWREHHEWHDHEWYARRWHQIHPEYVPHVVYAPPAVIAVPPPQPVGINLVIPFDIR